jgi:hypothetical protein
MTHVVPGTVTAVAPLVVAAARVVSGLVLAAARSPGTALDPPR